ncbi:hypothetical protein P153DRAFT_225757 [Dothidotthia symphoricarpi CBS 119687]|uniref:Uncharacterized protein n=1 Tax=Dothidotthia symphoricarpi CBS 119687 TaxID=1392245 RepID=A0A6A6AEX8_9PLEO|nr:uncharacterized protein P153DRAFT_225757 [Dothidotthia symphoricarpi CBS 119687]KAF2129863.1 hypothetical protein P153DRAFT_225757 [Dothidotthia symphoricarpi CBS 119687]
MPPTQLAHPSPKRKRDQPPQIPLLNTTLALRPASAPPRGWSSSRSSGADSPRNAVADQLRGMNLVATSAIPMSPLTPVDDVAHKKLKLDVTSLGTDFAKTSLESRQAGETSDAVAVTPRSGVLREIPETPQTPQPRMLPDIASFAQPSVFVSFSGHTSPQQNPTSTATDQISGARNRSLQLGPLKKPPSPSLSALTWQVTEITGHLADPSTDPDDDGTGLNGIGFKPTPAMAYARSQKRRQQLSEWKAREAREARAKRSERRRRGVGGKASRDSTVEREMPLPEVDFSQRSVKFAV